MSATSLENQFDIKKYMGVWYQFASTPMWFYPNGAHNIMANYELEEVSGNVKLKNTMTVHGKKKSITGKVTKTETPLAFKVRFDEMLLSLMSQDYVIKAIVTNETGDYVYAVVGGKDVGKGYYILSRTQSVNVPDQVYLNKLICQLGYSWNDLVFTPQIHESEVDPITSLKN